MGKVLTEKKPYKSKKMIRKAVYTLDEVIPFISVGGDNPETRDYDGDEMPMDWETLQVLKAKGCTCVTCGAEAAFVAKEKTPGPKKTVYNYWHFNVYAEDYLGRPVLLTKDHIVPRSAGGEDSMDNYQPMCIVCNNKKATLPQRLFDAVIETRNQNIDEHNMNHTIKRAKERWMLDINKQDFIHMSRQIREADDTIIYRQNKSTSYREIRIQGQFKLVLYSKNHGIITALSDEERNKVDKRVPWWAQQDVDECLELYDEIIAVAEAEYKEKESDRACAEYFKTCKYPRVMFGLWKFKNTKKFKNVVLEEVRKEMKL